MEGEPADPGAWYRPAHVHVAAYDEQWPMRYAEEADRIVEASLQG